MQLENMGSCIDMQTHAGNGIAARITSNRATVTVFVTVCLDLRPFDLWDILAGISNGKKVNLLDIGRWQHTFSRDGGKRQTCTVQLFKK